MAIECHHRDGVAWEKLIDLVYEMLLCSPDKMVTMCKKCHDDLRVDHVRVAGAAFRRTPEDGRPGSAPEEGGHAAV
ncbi:MAG TPA: hypothetical protein ACFYD4_12395 [Candidatus Wunengus sp. YC61]|uniref:hypothetical protein n=1 Tax=Candidatus Wunengus sp. YC61 TaxID=3367698 RepID=UPI004027159D